jgi:hypothetical protein
MVSWNTRRSLSINPEKNSHWHQNHNSAPEKPSAAKTFTMKKKLASELT